MKFKYKVATLTDAQMAASALETNMNTYGNQGWEIVNVIRMTTNNNVLVAKKRVE